MVRERMLAKGWTQMHLARLSGVPQSTLSKCLSGETTWNLDRFADVCTALGARASDLLAVAEETLDDLDEE